MSIRARFAKLIREPLIHFLGGALLVFGFFWATGTGRDPADYAITISESDIARLNARWVQNFRRPPTRAELDGLIDQEIQEEVYYREALRLGLDRNDPVIRRRLFTKMRFLDNSDASETTPSEAELQQWLDERPQQYTLSARYDLDQIYLGQAPDIADEDVAALRDQLNRQAIDPAAAGQPISLPTTVRQTATSAIARQFGEEFAGALATLPVGSWQGPVDSGFGQHLVKIRARVPGQPPSLDDVRQTVTNDWRAAQRARRQAAAFDRYRAQYDIQVAGRQ